LISDTKKSAAVAKAVGEFAIKIGLPEDAVSTLSGGNQQRVVLAKWLATSPKVLILDCPTVGVDVGARDGIYKIVRGLAERGIAIFMISDEVPEVFFNSDRILHMAGGRIVAEHDPAAPLSPNWSAPSMRDYLRTHEGEARIFIVLAVLMLFLASPPRPSSAPEISRR
jgi:simple sugar transport system ATP-binding protein